MWLFSSREVNAGESAELEDFECRYRNSGRVKRMGVCTCYPSDHDDVHYRQAQGLGDLNVDTALRRSGVDQGLCGVASRRRLRRINESGYDDFEARPESDERGVVRSAFGIDEGCVSEGHERAGMRPKPAWRCASERPLGG